MSRRANVIRHGANHATGGSDPIPGLGTAAGGPKQVLATWGGALPEATGTGQVWRVPYASDGSSYTFTLARAFARLDDPIGSDVTFRIEKSAGGSAFAPTTVTTLTIAAGGYDDEDTTLAGTVTSSDLLRIVFVAVGGGGAIYSVQLIGSE